MKTIIVPVDFSNTCSNAARHAALLGKIPAYQIGRIVLVNSYHVSIYEQILPSPDLVQVSKEEVKAKRAEIKYQLENLKKTIQSHTGSGVQVDTAESDQPLVRTLLEQVKATNADFIVMGTNDKQDNLKSDIGDQVIEIAKVSPVPVLIIPCAAPFVDFKTVLLPCDFRNLSNLAPLRTMQESDLWTKKNVLVLNVDPTYRRAQKDEDFQATEKRLDEYLQNIKHEVYYSDEKDTLGGILQFAADKSADLIIALPGKHSFFYSLTHKSISQALSTNSKVPVLVLK